MGGGVDEIGMIGGEKHHRAFMGGDAIQRLDEAGLGKFHLSIGFLPLVEKRIDVFRQNDGERRHSGSNRTPAWSPTTLFPRPACLITDNRAAMEYPILRSAVSMRRTLEVGDNGFFLPLLQNHR